MFRRLGLGSLPTTCVVAMARRAYVTDVAEADQAPAATPHSLQKMWSLWNEGNLFSLSSGELSKFLEANKVTLDPKWKKAALVRRVEELLQANENKAKGTSATPAVADPKQQYGSWDKDSVAKSEILLDLSQSGFYQGDTQSAPRAFQVLLDDVSIDLVVSRLNTTCFPGYPSNVECYTLSAADAEQASKARYLKALKWCGMNLKTFKMNGQMRFELGKLVLFPSAIKRNQRVLSVWTLQQRLQAAAPYLWVTAVSPEGTRELESFVVQNGFEPVNAGKVKITYDAVIRKDKKVSVELVLNSKSAVTSVNRPWERLQSTHFVRSSGPDVRFTFRARRAAASEDVEKFMKLPIVDPSQETIQILLPPEHGEIIYLSENETQSWSKPLACGGIVTLSQIKRQPLVISRDQEEGERVEYILEVDVPHEAGDLSSPANEVYRIARDLAAAITDKFVATFGTEAQAPSLKDE